MKLYNVPRINKCNNNDYFTKGDGGMLDAIPEFLKNEFGKEKPRPAQFPEEIKIFMLGYATHYEYPKDIDIRKIFVLMKNNIGHIPKCELDNCDQLRTFNKSNILTEGCCAEHTRQIRNLQKYGVTNVSHREDIKSKIKQSYVKKYGVEHPMKSEIIRDKFKATCLEKFGVENPSTLPEIQEKINDTNMKNLGVTRPMKNSEVVEKVRTSNNLKYGSDYIFGSEHFKDVMLETYGTDNAMKLEKFKKVAKNTSNKRWGVDYPMHAACIFEKCRTASYKLKTYTWKTGEISKVQGHEPIVLKELEDDGYTFSEVKTESKDMPKIMYHYEGSEYRYFPDIYIPKENLLIEVKSQYTLDAQLEKNNAKFTAAKQMGFNFRLEIR